MIQDFSKMDLEGKKGAHAWKDGEYYLINSLDNIYEQLKRPVFTVLNREIVDENNLTPEILDFFTLYDKNSNVVAMKSNKTIDSVGKKFWGTSPAYIRMRHKFLFSDEREKIIPEVIKQGFRDKISPKPYLEKLVDAFTEEKLKSEQEHLLSFLFSEERKDIATKLCIFWEEYFLKIANFLKEHSSSSKEDWIHIALDLNKLFGISIEEQKRYIELEYQIYYNGRKFSKNDHNIILNGELKGASSIFTTLSSVKPSSVNSSRPIIVPYLIGELEVESEGIINNQLKDEKGYKILQHFENKNISAGFNVNTLSTFFCENLTLLNTDNNLNISVTNFLREKNQFLKEKNYFINNKRELEDVILKDILEIPKNEIDNFFYKERKLLKKGLNKEAMPIHIFSYENFDLLKSFFVHNKEENFLKFIENSWDGIVKISLKDVFIKDDKNIISKTLKKIILHENLENYYFDKEEAQKMSNIIDKFENIEDEIEINSIEEASYAIGLLAKFLLSQKKKDGLTYSELQTFNNGSTFGFFKMSLDRLRKQYDYAVELDNTGYSNIYKALLLSDIKDDEKITSKAKELFLVGVFNSKTLM